MPGGSDTVSDCYLGRMKLNTHRINTNRNMLRKCFDHDQNRLSERNQRGNQYCEVWTCGTEVERALSAKLVEHRQQPRGSLTMKGEHPFDEKDM